MLCIYNDITDFNYILKAFLGSAEAQSRKSHRKSHIKNTDTLKSANRKPTPVSTIEQNYNKLLKK